MRVASVLTATGIATVGIGGVAAQHVTVMLQHTTLFTNEPFSSTVSFAVEEESAYNWVANVNGKEVAQGHGSASGVETFDFTSSVSESGHTTVKVGVCTLPAAEATNTTNRCTTYKYGKASAQAINAGVSLIPLILVIGLAMTTQMVELSLSFGIFVGSCIVSGSMVDGFKAFLAKYILDAVTEKSHQYVVLFTLFISALVGMIQKSGGIQGMTTQLLRYAKSRRMTCLIAFLAGLMIFFDDYTNCLVVGFSMRPVFDLMHISREKLAFTTDATAAPIASLMPISAWVGFEIDLISKELKRIEKYNNGTMPNGLSDSGFSVFIQSIPYRYYPIFMLFMQLVIILSDREFGPMLVTERMCMVYRRTDGGSGAFQADKGMEEMNIPHPSTPQYAFNMFVPILCLITLVVVILINIGIQANYDINIMNPTVTEIFSLSDPYSALLFGSFGASVMTLLFYMLQFKHQGKLVCPDPRAFFSPCCAKKETVNNDTETEQLDSMESSEQSGDYKLRMLMTPKESINAWLKGMESVFPAIIVLVLAWATGGIMDSIGANRFFQDILERSVNAEIMPTLTFIISMLMALATGTSWGTMTIMFPIVTLPAWTIASDPNVVIATIAAVLSGAVAGDHCSPISDTTVLSSIASGCDLISHVLTQAPYAFTIILFSILFGTLPVGYTTSGGGYSTGVAILIGLIMIIATVILIGAPVSCATGRYDLFTEAYLWVRRTCFKSLSLKLEILREDTKLFAAGFDVVEQENNQTQVTFDNEHIECVETQEKVITNENPVVTIA